MHTRIKLSKENLINNIRTFRKHIGGRKKIISIVKENAYGHGLKEVVNVIDRDTDTFAVDDIQELEELRKLTRKDIYMLGYVSQEDVVSALKHKGVLVVFDEASLKRINAEAARLYIQAQVNIKIDALLGRQGILMDDVPKLLDQLKTCPNISLKGVYTHFSNIEDTRDFSHAQKQIDLYKKTCDMVSKIGFQNIEKHISSTAGILLYDHTEPMYTHVRLGIGLYGIWPDMSLKERMNNGIDLKPVLRWATSIVQVKQVPVGYPIGYGLTYITPKKMTVAVVPQGYSDGYDRKLSNRGEVLIGGKRCPILGRVAMNMCVVDVSHVHWVMLEDEVILLGKQEDEEITAWEIADKIGTIAYEVVARISPLLPRVVV